MFIGHLYLWKNIDSSPLPILFKNQYLLFLFVYAGSLLPRGHFPSYGAHAFCGRGFFSCRAWAVGRVGFSVVALGISS